MCSIWIPTNKNPDPQLDLFDLSSKLVINDILHMTKWLFLTQKVVAHDTCHKSDVKFVVSSNIHSKVQI